MSDWKRKKRAKVSISPARKKLCWKIRTMSDAHKNNIAPPESISSCVLFLYPRDTIRSEPANTNKVAATIQNTGGSTIKTKYPASVDRAIIIPEKKMGFSSSVAYTQNQRPKRRNKSSSVVSISRSCHQNNDQNI